jgi:hypothetical protein
VLCYQLPHTVVPDLPHQPLQRVLGPQAALQIPARSQLF